MPDQPWILLTYKVPPEPVKKRVALWRRLKGMGAIYLQNGVCLLPKTGEYTRRLKMLEKEVADMGGEAVILNTDAVDKGQEAKVISRFNADRDEGYGEFIERCAEFNKEIAKQMAAKHFNYTHVEENDLELKKLRVWLEKIRKIDFYQASLALAAAERLGDCEALLDTFAQQVFEAQSKKS